ncbi:prohead protease [Synechococcus phage Ssp-JY38]|nr:prohead protease [Synechococcus phage Yong-L2-223]
MAKGTKIIKRGTKRFASLKFQPLARDELVKLLGDDIPDGYVAGWASTADIDEYNHKVIPGAFASSIEERGLRGPKGIKLLIGHDWQRLGGEIKVLEYRGTRLWIEAQLALNVGYVRDAYEVAKMVGGTNFSVGFMLQDYSFKETDDGVEYLEIARGDLFEVSIVPFPGNQEATMEFIKSMDDDEDGDDDDSPTTIAEFEKALVAAGLVKSRNDAREVTQVVKMCPELFARKEKEPSSNPTEPPAGPLLDQTKLTELTALVAKMKQVIAPVAK